MKQYKVTLTLTQPILGTVPKDPAIYTNYIAAQIANEQVQQEVDTLPNIEKGWTGFHQLNEQPILYDYVIKGFFKDACGMLRRANDTASSKLRAHKRVIDGLVFVTPRQIPLHLNNNEMGTLERPLRAQTAQGERIALARSDTCPPGTTLTFTLTILGQITQVLLKEWLDYGALRGLGQWRNAGYGTFTYTMAKL